MWAVQLRGLAKAYGDCVANRDVTFQVRRGTIHALVGENGAGKSTAMKMLYGLVRPDAGEIVLAGRSCAWRSPRDAIAAGIGMVHQHFMLAGPYSGLDNIILGAEPLSPKLARLPGALRPVARAEARNKLEALAAANHFDVDLDAPVETLPVGVQQRLEILKLLYREVDVLILDEPTAVLTPQEVDELFGNLRRLRDQGKTIIIITHKLREVLRLADDVTVMRRGAVVGSRPVAGTTEAQLAELMVGRAVTLTVAAPPPPELGADGLRLHEVTLKRKQGRPRLDGVSFAVRGGEIVGIAGVEGNGQSELLRLLIDPCAHFSRRPGSAHLAASGGLTILGREARRLGPQAVRKLGVGFVPEDRQHQGLVLDFDLTQNFLLGHQRASWMERHGFVRWGALKERVSSALTTFDIRPADPAAKAGSLSGGNQQKLVIARELDHAPSLLVVAQPTRGVDVGSIEFIHQRLLAARAAGCAILLISSELQEVMALSDRILVLYEGHVNGEFARGEADEATLGRRMGGGRG